MTNVSGTSSGSSISRQRRSVAGVPKRCWCGASIMANMSKSEANPCRRYYRCAFAASHKLSDDNHIFKWFDEALVDEVETLTGLIGKLENDMEELREEHRKIVFEKMEDVLAESKRTLKIAMLVPVIGCIFMIGIMKLL